MRIEMVRALKFDLLEATMRLFVLSLLLALAGPCAAQQFLHPSGKAYVPVTRDYVVQPETVIEIKNMPRVRDQTSFGICYGFSAWALVQHWFCQKEGKDCTNLDIKDSISPLAVTGWASPSDPKKSNSSYANHKNINTHGGHSVLAIYNARLQMRFAAESCFDFNKLEKKLPYSSSDRDLKMNRSAALFVIERIEQTYEQHMAGKSICSKCLIEDLAYLEISITEDILQDALRYKTFGEFLFRAFFQGCNDYVQTLHLPKYSCFPRAARGAGGKLAVSQIPTSDEALEIIRTTLKSGVPISFEGSQPFRDTPGLHAVAITGYRRACNTQGDCKDILKIQNSWGKHWQEENDDGWLDAKIFLAATKWSNCTMSWYTKEATIFD